MGYFSNGTEGLIYEEDYCHQCINYGTPNKGCPVWGIHLFYNYDQHKNKIIEDMLSWFIPRNKKGENKKCNMFKETLK